MIIHIARNVEPKNYKVACRISTFNWRIIHMQTERLYRSKISNLNLAEWWWITYMYIQWSWVMLPPWGKKHPSTYINELIWHITTQGILACVHIWHMEEEGFLQCISSTLVGVNCGERVAILAFLPYQIYLFSLIFSIRKGHKFA